MDINVFVSSTYRDMQHACRPAVLRGIETADDLLKELEIGHAAAVTMEDWDADYRPAVELCLEKIRSESTHYVGVLGYLHGYAPGGRGRSTISITKQEWKHALKYRGRNCIAMFVPLDKSPIDQELQTAAADLQREDQSQKQRDFRAEVLRKGVAQPFEDSVDLSMRVLRKVMIWANRGLREAGRVSTAYGATAGPPRRPGRLDLTQLGRQEQEDAFKRSLHGLPSPESKNTGLYILYGPHGYGHRKLMERLVRIIEDSTYALPRCYLARVGPLWRDNSQAGLLRALGGEIRPGWAPGQIRELTTELRDLLEHQDVILQISGLEGYHGGLDALLSGFWGPLVEKLPENTPNRLLCMAAMETKAEQLPVGVSCAEPNHWPQAVILPRLELFTKQELCNWLKSWFPATQAVAVGAQLMNATEGIPSALYDSLADIAMWEQ